jgi:hypothetical protein
VLALLEVDWIRTFTFIITLAKLLIANQAVQLVSQFRVFGGLKEARRFAASDTLEVMVEDTLEALLGEATLVDQIIIFAECLTATGCCRGFELLVLIFKAAGNLQKEVIS